MDERSPQRNPAAAAAAAAAVVRATQRPQRRKMYAYLPKAKALPKENRRQCFCLNF
jgi:hypothetical protein